MHGVSHEAYRTRALLDVRLLNMSVHVMRSLQHWVNCGHMFGVPFQEPHGYLRSQRGADLNKYTIRLHSTIEVSPTVTHGTRVAAVTHGTLMQTSE